jgi:uncharacterized membrane protein YeaQ/YmgE (transglycosylase-associated protein family)
MARKGEVVRKSRYIAKMAHVSPKEATMDLVSVIVWLVIGAIAGVIASAIMKGKGLALTGNEFVDDAILGIIGAFVGGWLLGAFGVSIGGGILAAIINAVIGACVFIFVVRLIRRA